MPEQLRIHHLPGQRSAEFGLTEQDIADLLADLPDHGAREGTQAFRRLLASAQAGFAEVDRHQSTSR